MAFRKYIVHFIAECEDCDWGTGDYLNGQKEASEHARKYNHKVKAESGYVCEYNGRLKKETD